MKSFFWASLNLIGFIILIFIYSQKEKKHPHDSHKFSARRLFEYLLFSIMLYLVFDTGMFLLDGALFPGSVILNYAFSMLFYMASPLPGIFYLFYCEAKKLNNSSGLAKRAYLYFLPALVNAVLVLTTPFTHFIFYIDEHNIYGRGEYFWVSVLLAFLYVFSVFPVLAVQSRKKQISPLKKKDIYLYLFPLPPLILTVIQMMNYGVLLIGFGFVFSAFLIYTYSLQSAEDRRSLAVRFHNLTIIQFAVISSVLMAGLFLVLENTTDEISMDYAAFNSAGTAHILEIYLNKEIWVLGTAARSNTIIEWISDENNLDKKRAAYDELINTLGVLFNNNIYIVAGGSGNEYSIDRETPFADFRSHAAISPDNPKDKWVFDLMAQDQEYNLNVDIDKRLLRKRVWVNFKLIKDGEPIGVICTGMELSNIAEQALLLNSSNTKSRTFIIDENGRICMDSEYLGEEDFLLYGVEKYLYEEVFNPVLISAVQAHLDGIDGYFSDIFSESEIVALYTGKYQYAVITPISATNWSLVTLYDSSSLFGIADLLPLLFVITAMLVFLAFSSNRTAKRLIFTPLKLLVNSIKNMINSNEQNIYGLERHDEIGLLSNTIQDYFVKGYYDELTGIYNRRYLETTFVKIMQTLSRTEFKLSVMMLDIDYFKKYNDTYGHGQGDVCLKRIAEAINRAIMRKGDFIARYGGEEFVVVLPHTEEEGAETLAESMLNVVRNLKIPHEKSEFGIVTVSIGVTTGSSSRFNQENYLKKADEALYMSKSNGRNRYTFTALD